MDVDVDMDDTGWGRFLRVQIKLDLTKSFIRGRCITIRGEDLEFHSSMKSFLSFFLCEARLFTRQNAKV